MVLLVDRHEGLVGVVVVVCLAGVVEVGGVKRPRDVFAVRPSLMTMNTSCISRSSNRDQHFSTPAVTKPFAGVASAATAGAIGLSLQPTWGCFTRFSWVVSFGVWHRRWTPRPATDAGKDRN